MTTPKVDYRLRTGRIMRCEGLAGGDILGACAVASGHARAWSTSTPEIERVYKAAVDVMSTAGGTLAATETLSSLIMPALTSGAVVDKLTLATRVPPNVSLAAVTSGPTGHVVAENMPKPLSAMVLSLLTVAPTKHVAEVIVSADLLTLADPAAERALGAALIAEASRIMDGHFCTGSGSIADGCTSFSSSGVTAAAFEHDIRLMLNALGAGEDSALPTAVFVASTRLAVLLASLKTTGGAVAFPDVTVSGGSIWGIPLLVSSAGLTVSGSPTESTLLLVSQAGIAVADLRAAITTAKSASVQLSDTPSSGATALVSLWQANLRSLRAERWTGWSRRSDDDVVALTDIQA